jgi:hypothetical protein
MTICKSCGADVPGDSKFCPKCGKALEAEAAGGTQGTQGPQDWRGWRSERRARRYGWNGVNCGSGTGWGEDWMSRWSWTWSPFWIMVNAVIFGLGVVLIGTLLFLASSGFTGIVSWENFWAFLLIGLGALGVIRETAKFLVSGHMPWGGGMIFAVILIIIGLAGLVAQTTGWSQYWWIFIIVGGGLAIVLVGIFNYFWMKARFKK